MDGSSSIAKRLGVSDLIIGLTIVSFGTSAPELLVNIIASFQGASDIGIGNILGSNIANIFLILGVAALIYPLRIKKQTTWKEIPLNILSGLVLIFIANDIFFDQASGSIISRSDGLILMVFFCMFIYYTFGLMKEHGEVNDGYKKHGVLKSVLMVIAGILGLAYGGQWVVNGAIEIATFFGLSEALIGLTIVAIGTSLPELATSAMAAYRRNTDIAVGNVVGSNLFNIFWVLGLSAVIKPLPISEAINVDAVVYLIATILLFLYAFIGRKKYIDRGEGAVFVVFYVVYIVFLVFRG